MLHELMHRSYIGDKVIEDRNLDFKQSGKAKEPLSEYGLWNAIQLNKNNGAGSQNVETYS